jgi:uncharacterized protein YgiM (DUF1202 family)
LKKKAQGGEESRNVMGGGVTGRGINPENSESFKQRVNEEFGEGAYTEFQNMEKDLQQIEQMTIDQQFIGINQDQERGRMRNAMDTMLNNPESLKIPRLEGEPNQRFLTGGLTGITPAQDKREVVLNSDPVAISKNGDYIKMRYRGSNEGYVENIAKGESYFIESTQQVRNEIKDENILGEDVSQIIGSNQKLEGVQLDNNWKEVDRRNGVQMRVRAQGNRSTGTFEPRYEVRSNNQSLSYGKAAKEVAKSNKSRDAKIKDLKQIARTATNNGIPMTVGGLREFLAADQKDLSEREQEVMDQNIRFQNRGIALDWGQKFRPNSNQ